MTDPSKPRIYLIASPQIDETALSLFLDDKGLSWLRSPDATDAEHVVEVSGRVCYMSFSSDTNTIRYPNKTYVENLIKKGHESVLEHASWTFIIDGVSRAFTHQLVRHRVGFAFSQLSQQYHDESETKFVRPAGLNEEAGELWEKATTQTLEAYKVALELLKTDESKGFEEKRLMRSAARSLLPNATETTIAVTANARAIRNFLTIRGTIVGDIEMRLVSAELLKAVETSAPNLFDDISVETHEDGWPIIQH